MDYYLLTDMTAQIGYELAAAGAETFRIEETMRRVLAAYGIECETFAIPNCVKFSFSQFFLFFNFIIFKNTHSNYLRLILPKKICQNIFLNAFGDSLLHGIIQRHLFCKGTNLCNINGIFL